MRKTKSRRLILSAIGVTVVVGLGAALALWRPSSDVEVGAVTRGSFERFVEEDGRARVRDRYVVASPVAGTVERTRLRAGDTVTEGAVVAVVRPASGPLLDARSRAELVERQGAAEAAIERAKLAHEHAEASRKHAEAEAARVRALAESGSLPARDLERAELVAQLATNERDEARFGVHMAEHQLAMVRATLTSATRAGKGPTERVEIKAPAGGRVLKVHQESESPVAAGATLLEVADPSALEVVVDLLSTDAVQVEAGAVAEIRGWGGPGVLAGRIRQVEPMATVKVSALGVEEQRVDVIVDPVGETDSWKRVGDGYRIDVRIRLEHIADAVRVPTTALFRERGEWCAYVVEGGRVHKRVVRLRSYGPLVAAVESGVAEGESIVLAPGDALREGARVRPIPVGP